MIKLYLLRHSETEENRNGILQGRMQNSITLRGRDEAKKIAKIVATLPITNVYTSTLQRAQETTNIVTSLNKNIKTIISDHRLNEIDMGIYEGKTKQEVSIYEMDFPPKGETIYEAFERVKNFMEDLIEQYDNNEHVQILIVSHNIILKLIINYILYGKLVTLERVQSVEHSTLYTYFMT